MPTRYYHRKIDKAEFLALMDRAGMRLNDFLFLTGRNGRQVMDWLAGSAESGYSPAMVDTMLLEIAARDPDLVDVMTEIANRYSIGPPTAEERDAMIKAKKQRRMTS